MTEPLNVCDLTRKERRALLNAYGLLADALDEVAAE